jgi:nucleoside 2-deoxyribosyltransferase
MPEPKPRVYCSGPLFNDPERAEMEEIARALEAAGFATFLPHRDGLEFRPLLPVLIGRGLDLDRAQAAWDRAIFALDVYQVAAGCAAVVVNLNGRVPDEGAVTEAALAYAAGRVVVGYKADLRSLVAGRDNAMVAGLFGFRTRGSVAGAVEAVREEIARPRVAATPVADAAGPFGETVRLGERIWDALARDGDLDAVADLLA